MVLIKPWREGWEGSVVVVDEEEMEEDEYLCIIASTKQRRRIGRRGSRIEWHWGISSWT